MVNTYEMEPDNFPRLMELFHDVRFRSCLLVAEVRFIPFVP